jgi:hypothetical protein
MPAAGIPPVPPPPIINHHFVYAHGVLTDAQPQLPPTRPDGCVIDDVVVDARLFKLPERGASGFGSW